MIDKLKTQFDSENDQEDEIHRFKGLGDLFIFTDKVKGRNSHHDSINRNQHNNKELNVTIVDKHPTVISKLIDDIQELSKQISLVSKQSRFGGPVDIK